MPRYKLRTLLIVLALAGLVAAGFAINPLIGTLAYVGCLLLFLSAFRLRVACQLADASPDARNNPWTPHVILLTCLGVAGAAFVAFCATCTVVQLPFTTWLVSEERAQKARLMFQLGLCISLPVGTAAAALVYWLSWPRIRST
jgi:hypothetical protein